MTMVQQGKPGLGCSLHDLEASFCRVGRGILQGELGALGIPLSCG